jgi:hypothetical protein
MTPELSVRTPRLELIAATLELLEAELAGPEALGAKLGVPVPNSWPPGEYDHEALDFFLSRIFTYGPSVVGWYNWYAIVVGADGHRESLVAGAGDLGAPAPATGVRRRRIWWRLAIRWCRKPGVAVLPPKSWRAW